MHTRALVVLPLLFALLACGGLMPLGDPIPPGEPAMLNLPEFNDLHLGMDSNDAAWAAPDVADGGLDASSHLATRSASCRMITLPSADPTQGQVVKGMRCVISRDFEIARLEKAWGAPDATERWEADGDEVHDRFWVDEDERIRAWLRDTERDTLLTLQILQFDPIEEILGTGELYGFQTKRWVGERMNQMKDQKMFMKGRTGYVDAHGVPRYGDRPRIWISHALADDDQMRITGWSTTLRYRSDEAFRDAIVAAVAAKVGKQPEKKDDRYVFGDAAGTVLVDRGGALELTVGTVTTQE